MEKKWYSLDLGDGIQAYSPTNKIQEAFFKMYSACGSPKYMGVYSRYDLKANMVTVYFTPAAKPLAEIFGAKECEEPPRDGLAFIAGPSSCLEKWPVGLLE